MGARGVDGTEEPVHGVVIQQDFFLGTFVVTQQQYRAVASRCHLPPALNGKWTRDGQRTPEHLLRVLIVVSMIKHAMQVLAWPREPDHFA